MLVKEDIVNLQSRNAELCSGGPEWRLKVPHD